MLTTTLFRKTTLCASVAALTMAGCASAPPQKTVTVSAAIQAKADRIMAAQQLFAQAEMTMPVVANEVCVRHEGIEPFKLDTISFWRKTVTPEMYTAFTRTGLTEKFSVTALLPGADAGGLKIGDEIDEINGSSLGNPIYNANSYTSTNERSSVGKSMTVKLADGRTLTMPTRAGCKGILAAWGYLIAPLDLGVELQFFDVRVLLPAYAIQELKSQDEANFMALWGLYFLATDDSKSAYLKQLAGAAVVMIPGAIVQLVPFVGPKIAVGALNKVHEITLSGMPAKADAWAQAVMVKNGMDSAAAVRLNERLAAGPLRKDAIFQMDAERLAAARARVPAAPEATQEKVATGEAVGEPAQSSPIR